MAQQTKNLGQVAAILISTTAPTNTKLLWYDDRNGIPADERVKYYNADTADWRPIAQPPIESLNSVDRLAANIAARDSLLNKQDGENVYVSDASSDPNVTSGWAVYKWFSGSGTWQLQAKEETVTLDLSSKENTGVAASLISALKAGVSSSNDTLEKIEDNLALKAATTDPRFTDQRIPTNASVTLVKLAAEVTNLINSKESSGTALSLINALKSTVTTANDTLAKIEANLNLKCNDNDARLSNERVPTANSVVNSKIPNDEIAETKLQPAVRAKLLTTVQTNKLLNVPDNTNASIEAASKHVKGVLSGNTTIAPDNHDTYYIYSEPSSINLIFDEDLSKNPKLPDALLIRTIAGAGDINLVSAVGNTLTIQFLNIAGQPVGSLPGTNDSLYMILLRPGTESIYDVYGDEVSVIKNIELLNYAQNSGNTLNNYNFTKGNSDNVFVHLAWVNGTPYTSVSFGGVPMTKELESETTFSPKLWHQVWRLKQADLPASGIINITASGGAGQTNPIIRVFRIKDSEQTTIGLLDVTGDGSNTRIQHDEAVTSTFNTIFWSVINGTAIVLDFCLTNVPGASWTQLGHQIELSDVVVGGAVSHVASYVKINNTSVNMRQSHNIGSSSNMSHVSFYLLQS